MPASGSGERRCDTVTTGFKYIPPPPRFPWINRLFPELLEYQVLFPGLKVLGLIILPCSTFLQKTQKSGQSREALSRSHGEDFWPIGAIADAAV